MRQPEWQMHARVREVWLEGVPEPFAVAPKDTLSGVHNPGNFVSTFSEDSEGWFSFVPDDGGIVREIVGPMERIVALGLGEDRGDWL